MKNELAVFENDEFGKIRTLSIADEPWFVGKDVAEALGYGNGKAPINAVANHVDPEDKGVTEIMTPGGEQTMTIINESGLYALIFGSKLESAKRFKRWVTSEVLPSIRKTGKFSAEKSAPSLLPAPEGKSGADELLTAPPQGADVITSVMLAGTLNISHSSMNRLIRKRAEEIAANGGNVDEYFFLGTYKSAMNASCRQYYITQKGYDYIRFRLSPQSKEKLTAAERENEHDIDTVQAQCRYCANYAPKNAYRDADMDTQKIDLTGKRFGRLKVLYEIGNGGYGTQWACECECGEWTIATTSQLRGGKTKSCGCLRDEMFITNGWRNRLTNLMNTYHNLRKACYCKDAPKYQALGARGINFCAEWKNDVWAFIAWSDQNGYSPHSRLFRRNPKDNYCPENCYWAPINSIE